MGSWGEIGGEISGGEGGIGEGGIGEGGGVGGGGGGTVENKGLRRVDKGDRVADGMPGGLEGEGSGGGKAELGRF